MNKVYFDDKGKLSLVLDNVKLQDNLVNNIDLSTVNELEIDKESVANLIACFWNDDIDVEKTHQGNPITFGFHETVYNNFYKIYHSSDKIGELEEELKNKIEEVETCRNKLRDLDNKYYKITKLIDNFNKIHWYKRWLKKIKY